MSQSKGIWILLEEDTATIQARGIPKKGDFVILSFESDKQPQTGTARRTGTSRTTMTKYYESKEYGSDFSASAMV